jgi:sterol desaturase/sphingolipid hydroxylase (fatty acid hydroxylase superfamily)
MSARTSKPARRKLPLDPIDLASAPMFIATMLAEAAVLRHRPAKRTLGDLRNADLVTLSGWQLPADPLVPLGYERKDTAASLAMLAGNVAFSLATMGLLQQLDKLIFGKRIANLGSRRGAFAMAMVTWDLLYYWDHRIQHEARIFWANHVSHHSSERYNLSTALRQPWSGLTLAWVFLPMPLLGFKAKTTFRAGQLNLLYQYWIHTEAIGRLPKAVEAVLNTPSHHRVHHGANQQYLDKNYGGILILWDKLFGTFEPELRRVKYGLTKNIATYNPLRIAYHEYAAMARDVARAKGWRHKLRHVLGPPGWTPPGAHPVGGLLAPS